MLNFKFGRIPLIYEDYFGDGSILRLEMINRLGSNRLIITMIGDLHSSSVRTETSLSEHYSMEDIVNHYEEHMKPTTDRMFNSEGVHKAIIRARIFKYTWNEFARF